MSWLQSLSAVSTIKAYREQAQTYSDEELKHALSLIANGMDPNMVLEQFAHRLTNKLTHTPSVTLKQAGYDGNTSLFTAAQELFKLKDPDL